MADKYATHLFRYRFEGQTWSFEIKAKDLDEAKRRLGALAWATYDGVFVARVPASTGPVVPLATWLRNAAHRLLNRVAAESNSG